MQESTEKPPLHSFLCECYRSSTQKLVQEHERNLHKRAWYNNHHIFNLRCHDEGVIPPSLRIQPPVKTREGYKIVEWAGKAFLSARICETYIPKRVQTQHKDQGPSGKAAVRALDGGLPESHQAQLCDNEKGTCMPRSSGATSKNWESWFPTKTGVLSYTPKG